jgi:glycosyltransferase involved in cell wall biosynthesis
MSLRILFVTYNWPPRNAIGTHRPFGWVKALARRGHSVTVLTAQKQPFDAPLDLDVSCPDGVRVIEVQYLKQKSPAIGIAPNGTLTSVIAFAKKVNKVLLRHVGFAPDIRSLWFRAAAPVAEGLALACGYDAVISTYGPSSSHRIAKRVKRVRPDIRWLADFRDGWSDNPITANRWLAKSFRGFFERSTCRSADVLTTVSRGLAESLESVHGRKVHVITNSYDGTALVQPCLEGGGERSGTLQIVYTGSFYKHIQDARPLFLAIDALLAEGALEPGRIAVDFYGARLEGLGQAMLGTKASNYVSIHGPVSRELALEMQRRASALLLLEVLGATRGGVLTGKMFEYMASGRPVLAVGDGRDRELSELLDVTGTGVSLGNSVERIKQAILDIRDHRCGGGWFSPQLAEIRKFSTDATIQTLVELLGE